MTDRVEVEHEASKARRDETSDTTGNIKGAALDGERDRISVRRETLRAAANEINHLIAETNGQAEMIKRLVKELDAEKRRADAALEDILIAHEEGRCAVCLHLQDREQCAKWPDRTCWQWRGPQAGEEQRNEQI